MTAQQFLDWLIATHNCENTLVEAGRDFRGFSIKIRCKNTGRHYYFSGPFGHVPMSKEDIEEICGELWITAPKGI